MRRTNTTSLRFVKGGWKKKQPQHERQISPCMIYIFERWNGERKREREREITKKKIFLN